MSENPTDRPIDVAGKSGIHLLPLLPLFGVGFLAWRLSGAEFGRGLVMISVMFGLPRGLDIRGFSIRRVYRPEVIYAFVMGVALAWLRAPTGSVWPGVAFHNFANVMNTFLA